MTSGIVVGTDCPTQPLSNMIIRSGDFHQFHEKWKDFASHLNVDQTNIKRLMQQANLGTYQLTDVVREVVEIWVGKTGSEATLDKLIDALNVIDLNSISELVEEEFQLKSSQWDVPSYYISRTVIARNVLQFNFMEKLQTSKDIFVFAGVSHLKVSNILKNEMVENSTRILQEASIAHCFVLLDYPTHFSKICKKAKCPVHLIRYDEKEDKWIHVRSSGNLSAMRSLSEKKQACVTETELIDSIESYVHPVCISDSPGMGKSTLLYSIGHQLSKIENRKVLFTSVNEFVTSLRQNEIHDDRKGSLELTFSKVFCTNASQSSSLSTKFNSENLEIELILDGLDEVTSNNMASAFDLLNYLLTISSIRVWVATRPHLLQQLEDCLTVFGYNIQAFTKQNQISFLREFWLSHNNNLVTERVEQFAEICLSELNARMSRKDGDIAGIPLQCLLIGEVYREQAKEHSVATNPNKTWIIQIKSLVELYQNLIEMQYNKYKATSSGNLLTEDHLHRQHIRLAVQLIFPELLKELPVSFKEEANLNELLKVGLLEKSSTVLEPKFVHRTIGEYLVAKFLVEILNLTSDIEILKCQDEFLHKILICQETKILLDTGSSFNQFFNISYFVSNEICHFFDTLLVEVNNSLCVEMHLNFKKLAQACIFGDYFNIFKTILFHLKPNYKSSIGIFDEELLLLAINYSSLAFLKIILENNATLLHDQETKIRSLFLSVRNGKLLQLQYLLNVSNVRELVTQPNDETKFVVHICVKNSASDSSFTIKQKIDILRILLSINFDLLEQKDKHGKTPIFCNGIHPELLRELIKSEANIFVVDKFKNTILHVHYPHLDLLFEELPVEKLKCLIKLKNELRFTPLMRLVDWQEPTIEILNKFHELGADFNCKDNYYGYSVLALSISKFRSTKTITRLIDLGANVHWKKGWKRQSLLHIAAKCGNIDAMRFLETQFNLNINEKDQKFSSSIDYLREFYKKRGHNLSNQQLINFVHMREELNIGLSSENKTTLLKKHVENMNDSAVESFLKSEVSFLKNNDMRLVIVEALVRSFKLGPGSKILQSLISSGIIETYENSLVVTTSSKNQFLIHEAIRWRKIEILNYLVDEYKQNVNATDDDGITPLQYLIKRI